MFIMIPGEVVAVFTFPGVVMHEVAHRLVCDLLNVPVYDVKYFIIHKDAAGYVYHARTSLGKNFLIAIAPLFVNTIFCMLFTFPLAAKNFIHYVNIAPWEMVSAWIGFSIGYNAFPSNQDLRGVYECAHEQKSYMSANIYAVYLIFKALNFLRRFYISIVYAFLISLILPCYFFGPIPEKKVPVVSQTVSVAPASTPRKKSAPLPRELLPPLRHS